MATDPLTPNGREQEIRETVADIRKRNPDRAVFGQSGANWHLIGDDFEFLLAALQQARQELQAEKIVSQEHWNYAVQAEARLTALDAALQGLETAWREEADKLDAATSGSLVGPGVARACAEELASVRAARTKET